jgi:hypothetical protein
MGVSLGALISALPTYAQPLFASHAALSRPEKESRKNAKVVIVWRYCRDLKTAMW